MTLIAALLERTSRTFALSIPMLPEPTRRETAVAYLLFRIADTLEDEPWWSLDERVAGLRALAGVVSDRGGGSAFVPPPPSRNGHAHEGYAELLDASLAVLGAWRDLDAPASDAIAHHLRRTIDGMIGFLERPGPPATLDDVRSYCYVVAGIVGELCTDLFWLGAPAGAGPACHDRLRELAPAFGEGLQLVNILRDEPADEDHGRRFVPREIDRAELFALASRGLDAARAYVGELEAARFDPGVVSFNALNTLLAIRTLALVRERGPGAKLTRADVSEIVASVRPASEARRAASLLAEAGERAPSRR